MKKIKLEAIIKHNGDEKYIVAKIGNNGTSKLVLVSMALPYHRDIAEAYKRIVGDNVTVLGGGILTMDHDAKTIGTYGMSGGFGKPKVTDIKKILTANFPEFTIDAKVTDYIRC